MFHHRIPRGYDAFAAHHRVSACLGQGEGDLVQRSIVGDPLHIDRFNLVQCRQGQASIGWKLSNEAPKMRG
jgi:hypothetical protein